MNTCEIIKRDTRFILFFLLLSLFFTSCNKREKDIDIINKDVPALPAEEPKKEEIKFSFGSSQDSYDDNTAINGKTAYLKYSNSQIDSIKNYVIVIKNKMEDEVFKKEESFEQQSSIKELDIAIDFKQALPSGKYHLSLIINDYKDKSIKAEKEITIVDFSKIVFTNVKIGNGAGGAFTKSVDIRFNIKSQNPLMKLSILMYKNRQAKYAAINEEILLNESPQKEYSFNKTYSKEYGFETGEYLLIITVKDLAGTKKELEEELKISIPPTNDVYPTSSYELSGNVLMKWLGNERIIDMDSDSRLSKIKEIGESAFSDNNHLEKIIIGGYVVNIGRSAFEHCRQLKSVIMHHENSVEIIDHRAFADCPELEYISLSNRLHKLGQAVFENCISLKTLEVKNPKSYLSLSDRSFKTIDGVLFDINEEVLYAYPIGKTASHYAMENHLTHIISKAFYKCRLESLTLSPDLYYIGSMAFASSPNLKSIIFPATVGHIEMGAFAHCPKLESVRFESEIPPRTLGAGIFQRKNKDYTRDDYSMIIHVPKGSIENYKAVEQFSKYRIEEMN